MSPPGRRREVHHSPRGRAYESFRESGKNYPVKGSTKVWRQETSSYKSGAVPAEIGADQCFDGEPKSRRPHDGKTNARRLRREMVWPGSVPGSSASSPSQQLAAHPMKHTPPALSGNAVQMDAYPVGLTEVKPPER